MRIAKQAPELKAVDSRDAIRERTPAWAVVHKNALFDRLPRKGSINAPLVYIAMATHARKDSRIVMLTQQRIATMLGVCRHTVGRQQQALEASGAISRQYRKPASNGWQQVWKIIDEPLGTDGKSATPGKHLRGPRNRPFPRAAGKRAAQQSDGSAK